MTCEHCSDKLSILVELMDPETVRAFAGCGCASTLVWFQIDAFTAREIFKFTKEQLMREANALNGDRE